MNEMNIADWNFGNEPVEIENLSAEIERIEASLAVEEARSDAYLLNLKF